MPDIVEFLYREYCRARLAEMRNQLWLSAPSLQIRDVGNPAGSADRDSNDRTAAQHKAQIH
jgi:hypothetical protein